MVTAAMVTSTKVVTKKGVSPGGKLPGPNGNGSKRRDGFLEPGPRANRYRIGIWVALASILMMFTALSSAYIVRAASSNDWVPLAMPRVLLLSTALILISSITIHVARRKLRAGFESAYARLLLVTALLGFSFLASQLFAWKQLARQGIFLTTNPHSSFFYLLTATHAGARASANRKGTQRSNPTGGGGCRNDLLAFYGRSLDLPISTPIPMEVTTGEH